MSEICSSRLSLLRVKLVYHMTTQSLLLSLLCPFPARLVVSAMIWTPGSALSPMTAGSTVLSKRKGSSVKSKRIALLRRGSLCESPCASENVTLPSVKTEARPWEFESRRVIAVSRLGRL